MQNHPKSKAMRAWCDARGNGLLHRMARNGNELILKFLLSKKICDLELRNSLGETPLLVADFAKPNIVRLLIGFGAEVNVANNSGFTPLHLAVIAKSKESVALLILAKADMTAVDIYDRSPLHLAVQSDLVEMVKLMLDSGADVNQQFEVSRSVLCVAARARSVLCVAARARNESMVRLLLEYGANVSYVHSDESTPLHFAVWLDDPSISRWMIEQGADVNQQDNDGFAVLHEAVYEGNLQQVKLLGEFKVDINSKTNDGDTPLHWATFCNIPDSPGIIEYLLEQGANVNERNFEGTTPLHFAAKRCSWENEDVTILDSLLKSGRFNVDDRNYSGFTPLHYAAESGLDEACAHLLDAGADIDAVCNNGLSPIYLAVRMRQVEAVELLLNRGAKITKASIAFAVEEDGLQKMSIVLMKHMAKLECAGMQPEDFKCVESFEEVNAYFEVCRDEIRRMKLAKIYEDVSMFDILTKRINVIAGYARNEQLVLAYEEKKNSWNFSNYADDIEERFMEEVRRQKIIRDASIVLNNLLPLDWRHLVMDKIVSYIGFDDLTLLATGRRESEVR